MKLVPLLALATAVVAGPALADVVHETSFEHQGQTVSASYEPRTKTRLKQAGLGSRGGARCVWSTQVSVERKIVGADGRPVAALSRPVGEPRSANGVIDGYCSMARDHQVSPFGSSREKLRAFVAEAAEGDTYRLRAEMASLGSLGHALAR